MKIINSIFCDDIRNEEGNKISLMGVYDDKIIFSITPDHKDTWPRPFSFAVFLRVLIEKGDSEKGIDKMVFSVGQEGRKQDFPVAKVPPQQLQEGQRLTFAVKLINHLLYSKSPIMADVTFLNRKDEKLFTICPDFQLSIEENVIGDPIKNPSHKK
ncbi:MAG: hypothetical protein VR65_24840 [Desulfobulbaceae bacterium BRH_c16a]|nr:MAG: hypothetical protein VR65_24840 [Desulfobulbaceae bacterium BRH_c16a]